MLERSRCTRAKRTYAIGDMHGRYDLFLKLAHLVSGDHAARPTAVAKVVLLGNVVDHGPDSARLVKGLMRLSESTDRLVVLKGSHEDMMVEALSGNLTVYGHWLSFGGRQTLLSWGVERSVAMGPATTDNLQSAAAAVGESALNWLSQLPLYHRDGDYLFVHAGIRPGVEIEQQDPEDLLWIKNDFLQSDVVHGTTVVHGHSGDDAGVVVRPNRIGIDTGAYRTNRLTALGIENGHTWTLETAPHSITSFNGSLPNVLNSVELLSGDRSEEGYRSCSPARPASIAFGDKSLDADLEAILGPWRTVPATAPMSACNKTASGQKQPKVVRAVPVLALPESATRPYRPPVARRKNVIAAAASLGITLLVSTTWYFDRYFPVNSRGSGKVRETLHPTPPPVAYHAVSIQGGGTSRGDLVGTDTSRHVAGSRKPAVVKSRLAARIRPAPLQLTGQPSNQSTAASSVRVPLKDQKLGVDRIQIALLSPWRSHDAAPEISVDQTAVLAEPTDPAPSLDIHKARRESIDAIRALRR